MTAHNDSKTLWKTEHIHHHVVGSDHMWRVGEAVMVLSSLKDTQVGMDVYPSANLKRQRTGLCSLPLDRMGMLTERGRSFQFRSTTEHSSPVPSCTSTGDNYAPTHLNQLLSKSCNRSCNRSRVATHHAVNLPAVALSRVYISIGSLCHMHAPFRTRLDPYRCSQSRRPDRQRGSTAP